MFLFIGIKAYLGKLIILLPFFDKRYKTVFQFFFIFLFFFKSLSERYSLHQKVRLDQTTLEKLLFKLFFEMIDEWNKSLKTWDTALFTILSFFQYLLYPVSPVITIFERISFITVSHGLCCVLTFLQKNGISVFQKFRELFLTNI